MTSDKETNCFCVPQTNEFDVEAVSLGELRKIRVGHNNEGASPGWFCESVTVSGPEVQSGSVTFLVNRLNNLSLARFKRYDVQLSNVYRAITFKSACPVFQGLQIVQIH